MNSLFDTMAARFAPGAEPGIRPRPLARFEGGGEGGLREEKAETVVNVPSPLVSKVPGSEGRPRPPHMSQGVQQDLAPPRRVEKTSSLRSQSFNKEFTRHQDVAWDVKPWAATPSPSIPTSRTPGRDEATPPSPYRPQEPLTETLKSTPKETPASDPLPTERIIETRLKAIAPQSIPGPAELLPSPPAPLANPAPAAIAEPPVIHIGRIEVSRPVPPAPQQPKSIPATPEPPRRLAPVSRTPIQSRLTDYLGWKK